MRNQKTIPCSSVFIRGPFTVAAETRVGRFCARQLPPRTTEKDGNNDRGITRINTDEKSENNSVFVRVHPRSFYRRRGTRVGRFCAGQLPPRTTEKHGNNDHGITRINTDEKSENNPCSSVFIRGPLSVFIGGYFSVTCRTTLNKFPPRNFLIRGSDHPRLSIASVSMGRSRMSRIPRGSVGPPSKSEPSMT